MDKGTHEAVSSNSSAQKGDATKTASKVYTLDDIKFNPENKVMAILSTLGLIGLVIGLIEKDDMFVKYHGLEFGFTAAALIILGFIPIINIFAFLADLVFFVVWIMGVIKIAGGERYDLPVVSDLALKMINGQ